MGLVVNALLGEEYCQHRRRSKLFRLNLTNRVGTDHRDYKRDPDRQQHVALAFPKYRVLPQFPRPTGTNC